MPSPHQHKHDTSDSVQSERAALSLPWQADRLAEEEDGLRAGEADEEEVVTPALMKIAAIAGLGGLLFGFDTGVVSGALVVIGSSLGGRPLTMGEESFLVTSALFGALAGSVAASRLADWKGRKPVIVGAAVLFAIGAFEQAAAQVYKEVIFGRCLVGLGVGLASMVLPPYLAEIAPPAYRGRLVTSLNILITGGQVVAYLIDAAFANVTEGWRWMFGLGAVPAILQLLLSFSIPESPRYHLKVGKVAAARKTLKLLNPKLSSAKLQAKIEEIQMEVGAEQEGGGGSRRVESSKKEQFSQIWTDKASRRALIVACGLQLFQQLTGFNTMMYFSAKIIQQAGLSQPAAFALFVAVSNWLCSIVTLYTIDRLGRRWLLLRTLVGQVLGMSALAFSFAMLPRHPAAEGLDLLAAHGASPWAFVTIASMTLFTCAFSLGLGNVAWVVQSEVFSQDLRALGGGLATATNWACNIGISSSFLFLSHALTPSGAFGLYAAIAAIGWVFTYALVPETKNLSLDEVRSLFETEVGMKVPVDKGRGGYEVVGDEEEREASSEEEREVA